MSAIKDVLYEIQEAIIEGKMSFTQIASTYGVTIKDIELIWQEIVDQEECVVDNDYFDDY